MDIRASHTAASSSSASNPARMCTDPIVGAILSGWRYDISNISPEMRTDYEQHLDECAGCRRRQTMARTIDVLLISVTTMSMIAFLLAAVVLHRVEQVTHISGVHLILHRTPITISLQVVAIAGLIISAILSLLVAIATPLPGFLSGLMQERIPVLRERILRRAA